MQEAYWSLCGFSFLVGNHCTVDQLSISTFQFGLISAPDSNCGCVLLDLLHGAADFQLKGSVLSPTRDVFFPGQGELATLTRSSATGSTGLALLPAQLPLVGVHLQQLWTKWSSSRRSPASSLALALSEEGLPLHFRKC